MSDKYNENKSNEDKYESRTEQYRKNAVEKEENLEEKIGILERVKYMAIPAVITTGAAFIPELKKKYNSLEQETREKYTQRTLIGASVITAIAALIFGYKAVKRVETEKDLKYTKDGGA